MTSSLQNKSPTEPKLAKASSYTYMNTGNFTTWAPEDIDKLEIQGLKEYKEIINNCRFFYRRDPIGSTVINKLVELTITDLIIEQNNLTDNEYRIYTGLQDEIKKFVKKCATEYLVTGLVIPEIKYTVAQKETLVKMGVKKYSTLEIPESMWLRDPSTVEIKTSMVLDKPSFFVILPEELVFFIQNKGAYADGSKDIDLYNRLIALYPDFVKQVLDGNTKVLLKNDLITRRKVITGSAYPTPYLYPALESLKHKRNMRRMDYSLAARVISAIMLVKEGNDEFPVTEAQEGEDPFSYLRSQMMWRNSSNRDVEKIFMLFTNHTTDISWVMPDISVLIDPNKYVEINQDIFFALGFPRILTTGETERTQTSNAEYAMISPTKTMEGIQEDLLPIVKDIVYNISKKNSLKDVPEVYFNKINLKATEDFVKEMTALYETGNISRQTYTHEFGYNFTEEMTKKKKDEELISDLGITEFAPKPYSPQPEKEELNDNNEDTKEEKDKKIE